MHSETRALDDALGRFRKKSGAKRDKAFKFVNFKKIEIITECHLHVVEDLD